MNHSCLILKNDKNPPLIIVLTVPGTATLISNRKPHPKGLKCSFHALLWISCFQFLEPDTVRFRQK
jgi:hypothetical protein